MKMSGFKYSATMIQLYKLPKTLKIPFEHLEFESKMIGEGKLIKLY